MRSILQSRPGFYGIILMTLCLLSSCGLTEEEVCGEYYHRELNTKYVLRMQNGVLQQIFIKDNDSTTYTSKYQIRWSDYSMWRGQVVAPDNWITRDISKKNTTRSGACMGCELYFDNNTLNYKPASLVEDKFYKYKSCEQLP